MIESELGKGQRRKKQEFTVKHMMSWSTYV